MGLKTSVLSEHDTVTPFIKHQLYVLEVLTPQNLQSAWHIGQELLAGTPARQEFRTMYQLREILSQVASLLPSGFICTREYKAIICLTFWLHGAFNHAGGGSSGFSSSVTGSLLSPPL